jgi:hypothetical protein
LQVDGCNDVGNGLKVEVWYVGRFNIAIEFPVGFVAHDDFILREFGDFIVGDIIDITYLHLFLLPLYWPLFKASAPLAPMGVPRRQASVAGAGGVGRRGALGEGNTGGGGGWGSALWGCSGYTFQIDWALLAFNEKVLVPGTRQSLLEIRRSTDSRYFCCCF